MCVAPWWLENIILISFSFRCSWYAPFHYLVSFGFHNHPSVKRELRDNNETLIRLHFTTQLFPSVVCQHNSILTTCPLGLYISIDSITNVAMHQSRPVQNHSFILTDYTTDIIGCCFSFILIDFVAIVPSNAGSPFQLAFWLLYNWIVEWLLYGWADGPMGRVGCRLSDCCCWLYTAAYISCLICEIRICSYNLIRIGSSHFLFSL